jgi:Right handed beta helix region
VDQKGSVAGSSFLLLLLLLWASLTGCSTTMEGRLRRAFATQTTGVIQLPTGVTEITSELVLAPGAHDLEIAGSGSILKADESFKGRAIIVADGAQRIKFRDFTIDGNRRSLEKSLEMVPPENALRNYYADNGILLDRVTGAEMTTLRFANVVSFPILVSRSSGVRIREVSVEDSGGRNAKGRNNLTGGILIEEGTSDFEVRNSIFRRILGNALWTHSLATSQRLKDGVFDGNKFDTIGRDAIQVGHATNIKVSGNTGRDIGWPTDVVDVENGGTPVAIDTAGNVDHTEYSGNKFEEVNGKCFDLDGFHDGVVKQNQCSNLKRPQDYLFGHFGIVMNNSNPEVHAENIVVEDNLIDGTKYGALFLMGRGHRILNNRFLHVNQAQCSETKEFLCVYRNEEPHMLDSGIYLGRGVARMEETRENVIRGNTISGHKMDQRCIMAGPGVSLKANTIAGNHCSDYSTERKKNASQPK